MPIIFSSEIFSAPEHADSILSGKHLYAGICLTHLTFADVELSFLYRASHRSTFTLAGRYDFNLLDRNSGFDEESVYRISSQEEYTNGIWRYFYGRGPAALFIYDFNLAYNDDEIQYISLSLLGKVRTYSDHSFGARE